MIQLPTQAQEIVQVEDEAAEADPECDPNISTILVPSAAQSELLVPPAAEITVPTLFGQALPSFKRKGKNSSKPIPEQGSLFIWN